MTQTKHPPSQRMKRNQREIIRRVVVRGLLVLESPTCLGSGDADSPTDMPLLRDTISQNALLTGASIAGTLRNYLREYEHDYGVEESKTDLATTLFGSIRSGDIRGDDDGDQSPLIIYDSISSTVPTLELRDGVKIDSKTGTATDKAKYDLELLAADTNFPLVFELLIDPINASSLLKGLAIALQGLEKGEVSIGMKKRRGFGRCHVDQWQVWDFNLEDVGKQLEWLTYDHWTPGLITGYPFQRSIVNALGVQLDKKEDKRDRLTISAIFNLASPILIRSGQADTKSAPDVVHLKSHRPKKGETNEETELDKKNLVPVVSGTSLAGVLRHRAERIVKTLQCAYGKNPECEQEPEIVKSIFGDVSKTRSQASRLTVHESIIENATEQNELVQTRIAIDRFTGGAYPGALFQEQPIFNSDDTCIKLELELRKPEKHEIGLLLLLLKDLWTEDLPVGGTSSIGRGRLKGKQANITWQCSDPMQWEIKQTGNTLIVLGSVGSENSVEQKLETYIHELSTYVAQKEKS